MEEEDSSISMGVGLRTRVNVEKPWSDVGLHEVEDEEGSVDKGFPSRGEDAVEAEVGSAELGLEGEGVWNFTFFLGGMPTKSGRMYGNGNEVVHKGGAELLHL